MGEDDGVLFPLWFSVAEGGDRFGLLLQRRSWGVVWGLLR